MEKQSNRYTHDLAAITAIAVSIFALYIPQIITGASALAMPLEHDIIFQWIPFKEFMASCLRKGYIPLWTNNVFAGMPFLGFSHTGVLYPSAWLLLDDYAAAVNWFYPLQLVIAACGMFMLLRALIISAFPAVVAAIATVLAGKFFYFIHFLPSACSNPLSPWFFYFVIQGLRLGKFRHFIGLAIVFALQILGGDVESTSYQLIFALPFILALWWKESEGMTLRRLVPVFIALAAGALCASSQLLPLIEYSGQFLRAPGVSFDYFSQRKLPLEMIRALLIPPSDIENMNGLFSDKPYFYIGGIVFIFSIFAFIRGAKPSSRSVFILAILALVYSFGSIEILDALIYRMPLVNRYGAPEHAFYLFQIFIGVAAAQGLEAAARIKSVKNSPSLYRAALAVLILAVLFTDTWLRAFNHNDRHEPELYRAEDSVAYAVNMACDKNYRFVSISRVGINDPELVYHLGMRLGLDFIDGWITVPPLDYAKLIDKVDGRAVEFDENGKINKLGLNVDLRDGLFISADSMPLLDLLSLRYMLVRGLNLKFASPYNLWSDPETGKIEMTTGNPSVSFPVYIENGDMLGFQKPVCQGRECQDAHAVLQAAVTYGQARKIIYQALIENQDASARAQENPRVNIPLDEWAGKEVILQFSLNFPRGPDMKADREYIIYRAGISNPSRPIQRIASNSIQIYENREALPRAFMAYNAEVVTDRERLLEKLANMDRFELRKTVLLEKDSAATRILRQSITERGINPAEYKSVVDRIKRVSGLELFKVWTPLPGILFMSEQYLPGWRAEIDGKEWPLARADFCFRSVFVPEGKHTVKIFYRPLGFRIGLWASIATILSILFIACFRATAREQTPREKI